MEGVLHHLRKKGASYWAKIRLEVFRHFVKVLITIAMKNRFLRALSSSSRSTTLWFLGPSCVSGHK